MHFFYTTFTDFLQFSSAFLIFLDYPIVIKVSAIEAGGCSRCYKDASSLIVFSY
jgi:hypothetical protein